MRSPTQRSSELLRSTGNKRSGPPIGRFREILGLNAQFLETSPGAVFSFDELLALLEPLVDKGNWPALRARFLDDPAKGDTAHFDFQLRNGRVVRLYLHAMAGGGRAITVFDITDLAGASVDALAIEQRYALALDASEQSIWDWDLKTDQVTIGERFWDQIGRPDLGPRVSLRAIPRSRRARGARRTCA